MLALVSIEIDVSKGISENNRLLFAIQVSCQISGTSALNNIKSQLIEVHITGEKPKGASASPHSTKMLRFVFAVTLGTDRIARSAAALSKSSLCPVLCTPRTLLCPSLFLQINCDHSRRRPVSGLPHFKHHLSGRIIPRRCLCSHI